MLSDGLLSSVENRLVKCATLPNDLDRGYIGAIIAELRDWRAGKLVPEGKVLVDEGGWAGQ